MKFGRANYRLVRLFKSGGGEPGGSGHSIIFWKYQYDENGSITGFHYIDSHGINGGHESVGTVSEIPSVTGYTKYFGGNLKDK